VLKRLCILECICVCVCVCGGGGVHATVHLYVFYLFLSPWNKETESDGSICGSRRYEWRLDRPLRHRGARGNWCNQRHFGSRSHMPAHWLTTALHLRLLCSFLDLLLPLSQRNSCRVLIWLAGFYLHGRKTLINPLEVSHPRSRRDDSLTDVNLVLSRALFSFFLQRTLFLWVTALRRCRIILVTVLLAEQIYRTPLDTKGVAVVGWQASWNTQIVEQRKIIAKNPPAHCSSTMWCKWLSWGMLLLSRLSANKKLDTAASYFMCANEILLYPIPPK